MSYDIDAHIRNGRPNLRIRDASTGSVRLTWDCPAAGKDAASDAEMLQRLALEEAVHDLFKKLFLMTSARYLREERERR